jgi:serine/threonine protein kinase
MQEKKILVKQNQELEKELETIKTNVAMQCSAVQQDYHRAIDTAGEVKVSLDNFQFIRRLGKVDFGQWISRKGRYLENPNNSLLLRLKKRNITSSNICEIIAEKEALVLTTGHPFITTLYSCFQIEEHIFFVLEYMSGGELKEQLDEVGIFSEKRAKFYTA